MYDLLQIFTVKTASVVMEALPFILLGSLVSSLIHIYVSEETVVKSVPKSVFRQILSGITLAFFVPSCECGIVPIVRRLNAKGVPAPMSAAYMAASPVVNPVVIISTYTGFRGSADMTLMRIAISIAVAFAVGYLFSMIKQPFIDSPAEKCGCSCCGHDGGSAFTKIISHAREDFVPTFVFLIIGASFAGAFHVFMPEKLMDSISGSGAGAIAFMMLFAVILSVCSEADSFVAASFINFSPSSMLAFVNIGPVFDLKLLMMYPVIMRKRTMLKLVLTASALVFCICLLVDVIGFGGRLW